LRLRFELLFLELAVDLFHYPFDCGSDDCDDRSFVGLFLEKRQEKLFNGRPNIFVPDLEGHFQYLVEDLLVVLPRVERRSMEDLVEDDAQRPDIDRVGVVVKLGLLGSDVLLGACDGLHDDLLGAEPEVCQFDEGKRLPDDVLGLQQNVFGLQVAVSDPVVVELLDALADLQDALQGLPLSHLVVLA
jgi:hypothetical protein